MLLLGFLIRSNEPRLERLSFFTRLQVDGETLGQKGAATVGARLEHILVPIFVSCIVVHLHDCLLRHARFYRDVEFLHFLLLTLRQDWFLALSNTDYVVEAWRRLGARSPLLLGELLLLNFPLLGTRLDVYLQRPRSILTTADVAYYSFGPFHHF